MKTRINIRKNGGYQNACKMAEDLAINGSLIRYYQSEFSGENLRTIFIKTEDGKFIQFPNQIGQVKALNSFEEMFKYWVEFKVRCFGKDFDDYSNKRAFVISTPVKKK